MGQINSVDKDLDKKLDLKDYIRGDKMTASKTQKTKEKLTEMIEAFSVPWAMTKQTEKVKDERGWDAGQYRFFKGMSQFCDIIKYPIWAASAYLIGKALIDYIK